MNLKFITIIISAIFIGIGSAIYVARENSQTTTPDTTSQNQPAGPLGEGQQTESSFDSVDADHVVIYSDEGYLPQRITIQAGETVAFVNQSSRDVWTASDPHPSHTDLPELDARRAEAPGATYMFTFNQPGEWGYHNHLNSTQSGVVIVQ